MKRESMLVLTALLLFISAVQLRAQPIPDVTVENMKGVKVSAKTICLAGKPTVVSLWATWCKPCIQELDAVSEVLEDWREELDFRFVAVSVDDARAISKARTYASARGWDGIDFFFDSNAELQRKLNVSSIPYVLIYDSSGKLVYSHVGYLPGGEEEIFSELKKIAE